MYYGHRPMRRAAAVIAVHQRVEFICNSPVVNVCQACGMAVEDTPSGYAHLMSCTGSMEPDSDTTEDSIYSATETEDGSSTEEGAHPLDGSSTEEDGSSTEEGVHDISDLTLDTPEEGVHDISDDGEWSDNPTLDHTPEAPLEPCEVLQTSTPIRKITHQTRLVTPTLNVQPRTVDPITLHGLLHVHSAYNPVGASRVETLMRSFLRKLMQLSPAISFTPVKLKNTVLTCRLTSMRVDDLIRLCSTLVIISTKHPVDPVLLRLCSADSSADGITVACMSLNDAKNCITTCMHEVDRVTATVPRALI